MTYAVIFRTEARDEILEAARYILEQAGMNTAVRWYEELETTISELSEMPHRCPPAREDQFIQGVTLRQLFFKSHRIIFTVQGQEVHILHVRHVARSAFTED